MARIASMAAVVARIFMSGSFVRWGFFNNSRGWDAWWSADRVVTSYPVRLPIGYCFLCLPRFRCLPLWDLAARLAFRDVEGFE